MWQGGPPGPLDNQWNVGAAEFVPGFGNSRGGGPPGVPGLQQPMGATGPPPMQPPQGFPGSGFPGMPWGSGMPPGMAGPGWPRGPGIQGADSWHQQQPPPMPGWQGMSAGMPPGPYASMQGGMGVGANQGMPMQAEKGAPTAPAEPQAWAAIWNLPQHTDEKFLRSELDEIDFLPDSCVKVNEFDGAFLLGYSEYPFLADALWVALDETTGHVKDNGQSIRVAKYSKDAEAVSHVPQEILRAFESLPTQELVGNGGIVRQI